MSDDPLQFDRAEPREPEAHKLSCIGCGQAISETYFRVQQNTVCPGCAEAIAQSLSGGSRGARFAKALILGGLAAALGAGIWFAVVALSGYQIGLVAIVVGLLVGAGVRKGSEGRGGWGYQTLAVLLTYAAIGAAHLPLALNELKDAPAAPAPAETEPKEPEGTPAPPAAPAPKEDMSPAVALLLLILLACALALALPILMATQSILTLLIFGFALFEAWQLNRRVKLDMAGPFRIGGASAGA